jgi:prolyl oligopeptidase
MGFRVNRFAATTFVIAVGTAAAAQQAITYPSARKIDHADTYHGVKVDDPYRWLEDDNSPETAAWVEAQNKVTFGYLESIPYRTAMAARVRALNDYERYSNLSRKAEYVFFRKNIGLQDQSVLYVQKGLDAAPEVLIDPNAWGTKARPVPLTTFSPSRDAKYAVYGKSPSGSDWQEYHVMELATKKTLEDTLQGQGLERRVGRRRILLQPLPCPGPGESQSGDQRGPSGVLPQGRDAAIPGSARVLGSGQSPALPHRRDHR